MFTKKSGLCNRHYKRWYRYGDATAGDVKRRARGLSEADSFAWFMPGEPPEAPSPTEGCWDWTASLENGYGQFSMTVNGKLVHRKAHRVSYKIYHGEIPEGLHVLHSCDRKICVQPAHLSLGTNLENNRQAHARGLAPIGERHGGAKLTESDVVDIRRSDDLQRVLSERFGVSQSVISRIRSQKAWKHV